LCRRENGDDKVNNEEKIKELIKLAKPLQEWLLKNYDLECEIIIDALFVNVMRNEIGTPIEIDD